MKKSKFPAGRHRQPLRREGRPARRAMRLRRGWLPPAALPLACVCGALLMAVAAGASAAAWALSDFGDAPAEPPALRPAAARAAVCRCRAFLRWTPARLRFSGVPRATREWFSAGGATEEACRAALEKEDGDGAKVRRTLLQLAAGGSSSSCGPRARLT